MMQTNKFKINWNFPDSNYGELEGLNNPGIETFKGHHSALGREIIQNSLDAGTGEGPVKVEFSIMKIQKDAFPGYEKLLKILTNCKEFWKNNEKTVKFFNRAISKYSQEYISVLRVSDFNTTGLTDSDKVYSGNWNNLVKSSGATEKKEDKTGSFGIGKNAAFNASNTRTVFYSTYDYDDRFAFQGVSKLVTHNKENVEKRGTGFYGYTEKNTPVFDSSDICPCFYEHRPNKEVGTDIFIVDYYKDEGWDTEIIKSVISSFFQVIHDGNLEVTVNDTHIDTHTLPALLEKYNQSDGGKFIPYSLYKALVEGTVVSTEIERLGKVELKIYCNENFDENNFLPSKVALTRNGMTITTNKRFNVRQDYAAVFKALTPEGNAFLRELEPPQHHEWKVSLYENDEATAKRVMGKLYKWIGNELRNIAGQTAIDSTDAYGIGQYLPGEDEESGFKSNTRKSIPGKDKIIIKSGFDEKISTSVKKKKKKKKRELDPNDIPNDVTPSKKPSKHNPTTKKKEKKVPIHLEKVRAFCLDEDKGLYRIIMRADADRTIYFAMKIVAEDNGKSDIEVLNVINVETAEDYMINGHDTGPVIVEKKKDITMDVKLSLFEKYALEVFAYEIVS